MSLRRRTRAIAATAGCLWALGVVIIIWYAEWGVHGCNDLSDGASCSERMDRDYAMYLIGLGAVLAGTVLATAAIIGSVRGRRERAQP
jgi:hypothetical protein